MKRELIIVSIIFIIQSCTRTNESKTDETITPKIQKINNQDSLSAVGDITDYLTIKEKLSNEINPEISKISDQINDIEGDLVLYTENGLKLFIYWADPYYIKKVLERPNCTSDVIEKMIPYLRNYHAEHAFQIVTGEAKIDTIPKDSENWIEYHFEPSMLQSEEGPGLIAKFKSNMSKEAKAKIINKIDSLTRIKQKIDSTRVDHEAALKLIKDKYHNFDSVYNSITDAINQKIIKENRELLLRQSGVYSYTDNSGEFEIIVDGNIWRGKIKITSGFGADFDARNVKYEYGVVKGNILYDNSGYSAIGYIRGNKLHSSLGENEITLTKN